MAANVAPPKNTGGGGFVFEDDVCAWFLGCMLADEPPFDAALGAPVRVDFQTRVDGWFLDDALVTTGTTVGRHRFALSIKSNQQFTASSAPSDFVACAWEQWLHLGSTLLLPNSDFIGLVTGPLSAAARASVSGLLGKARDNDPELFPGRIATPNWASEHERHLFRSFECPASVTAPVSPTDVDTARLLQRIRFAEMDFGDTGGESQKRALALLRRCVHGGEAGDAHAAWAALRSIAAELRPLAGSITRLQLVDRLRGRIRLTEHPDHTADWKKLEARSVREASLVGDRIASRAHIQRPTGILALTRALETSELIALVGPSGAGKSAAMRAVFDARNADGERTVWVAAQSLDCRDIDDFLAGLGLQHDLADLLAADPSVRPVLILDGADRLYADAAFRNIAVLLHLVRPARGATQWRVVVACQAQEWPRVSQALGRQAVIRGTWATVELAPPALADLRVVGESIPAVAPLLLQPKLGAALTNLKLLDLVARRLEAEGGTDSSSWLGESSVAAWFWSAEVDRGPDGIARGRAARELATRQADSQMPSVAADDFGPSLLVHLQSLASDKLCVQLSDDRITFTHDLYGDWTRLRILLNQRASLPLFLRDRLDSPLWHRALRLFGAYLLERPGGLEEWRAAIASFDQSLMVQDVLVEAPVFSPNASELLALVFEDLLVGNGRRLRRLLARFLAFATLPDAQMLEIGLSVGMDAGAARSTFRQPYWPLWLPMLRLLHGHRTRVVAAAPDEVARLVEMWLAFPQKGSVGREHAADLAILLGRRALGALHDNNNDEDRERFYKCTLAAASERPDDATAIALRGSERLAADPEAPRPTRPRLRSRAERAPWPDGPRHPVDACLQKAVLDGPGALHLFRARPAVAREVVLANLIKAPEDDPMEHSIAAEELGLVYRFEWSPPLYSHGPFLGCLRHDFEEGLELVAQLVEFASGRAREDARRESSFWYDDDQMLGVTLLGVSDTRFVPGNKRIYGWSARQGAAPLAVACALMALEKYFYQRLDDGREISTEVAMALGRAESTALLGVLCDVGKREPSLFEGPLRPLLSAPEIYSWEIAKRVEGRGHLLFGAPEKGAHFVQLAHEFHSLEHRNTDLRSVAVALMTRHASMRDYFDRCCDAWSANPEGAGEFGEMRRQLSMALNFRNCRLAETSDGRVQVVNVATLQAQEARAAERVAIEHSMLLMAFPSRCRTILDGREELGREQLTKLWEQWLIVRQLADGAEYRDEPAEPLFENPYACAIAAGIAVFLGAGDWCTEYGRVPELTHALQRVLASLVDDSLGSRTEDVLSTTTPCFVADAVARLWLMAPRDREWRTAVGNVILSYGRNAVRVLFRRCAERRGELGQDFGRLRRLALSWAYCRERTELLGSVPAEAIRLEDATREREEANLARWREEALGSFVSAAGPGMPANWEECDSAPRFSALDEALRPWSSGRPLDFAIVRASHEWLPRPADASDADERESLMLFWRTAVEIVVASPVQRGERRYPNEDQRWVLERVGTVVVDAHPAEAALWHAVLDLDDDAHDWVATMVRASHRTALLAQETPAGYVGLIRAMIARAFDAPDGRLRWRSHEDVWDALVGTDGFLRVLWEPRHVRLVEELEEVFATWMASVPAHGRRLAGFASWLARPAGTPVRVRALVWLATRLCVNEDEELREVKNCEESVARLLDVVWTEQEMLVRSHEPGYQAFRSLLRWLVERQNPRSLELFGRLGGLS